MMAHSIEQLHAFLEWDVVNWARALEYWDRALPRDLSGFVALEVGANRGGLSLWLALRNATVVCSDVSDPAPAARPLHDRWDVGSRIRYEEIDATRIRYVESFDVVVFKSVLGGIGSNGRQDKKQQAIEEIHKALKPGGRLLFAENLEGSVVHRVLRRTFVSWGRRWSYCRREELLGYLAPFSSIAWDTTGFLGALGRSPSQRVALGTIDQLGVSRIVGRSNHYIMYGVATK